jgi:hypothetical protein
VKKAPGPDNIPNKALKLLPDKVVVALTTIINASLRLCHFPSRWKKANVIFIPKPGKDPKFPQNHRPISLLSSIGKVLEKVILTRLVRATNENRVLPDEQFGFRPQHSTSDQLIHVIEFIARSNGQIDYFILCESKLSRESRKYFLSGTRHRGRRPTGLCTQSSLPTFRNPTKQKSRCMQTTLQFLRALGRP